MPILTSFAEVALLLATAAGIGHVTENALGLVTMLGLVTIAASTYMITYSHQLYGRSEPLLGIFERKNTTREPIEAGAHAPSGYRIIIFGLGRFGTAIGLRLHERGIRMLGVDFNPQAVRRCSARASIWCWSRYRVRPTGRWNSCPAPSPRTGETSPKSRPRAGQRGDPLTITRTAKGRLL
ncbi:MAG: hypothetical protein U0934_00070 [Pseudotabrizicola sp.]|uniref:hypothetical protein n=1 Tax=Pseudotabrizicola sp. TaxID=2939647 RepID=UPI002725A538|nr:hypothetical protein [Pseudotabrizicola sp.]MDO8884678.1 hypothetical protein [Pseudotabrizicola sp.]MDP2080181.1 hypothetical protein [Pseudotabrizicola sp.]MDZ7572336.1 hypothetical protein [Pseudotabrizicola sp.]